MKRFAVTLVCLVATASCTTGRPAEAAAAPPATHPSTASTTRPVLSPRNDLPGLSNFAKVSPGLYRGAQPTAEGFNQLKKLGIKTVIDLRTFHDDRELMRGTGLRYIHIYCKAWHPEDEDIVRFLKVVEDPANQPVFVHCEDGADRTGCAVAVYRMLEQRWSVNDATAEMKRFGFHPIWTDIPRYLKQLDLDALKQKVKAAPAPRLQAIK